MGEQHGAAKDFATLRGIAVSDAEERLIYANLSGNQQGVTAAIENLNTAREMPVGPPSSKVVERLILNDPLNAALAGLH